MDIRARLRKNERHGERVSAAIFTWLGFYVPVDIGAVTWERKTWKLFLINTLYHLGMLIIAGVILNHMMS